jgi:hypothetical protein
MPTSEIADDEMFATDFDWFAVDRDGCIGHFTTAGLRRLPESVRISRPRLERLREYFECCPSVGRSILTAGLEKERGFGGRPLNWMSFLDMAARGLYSYDTELVHEFGLYYRAATPEKPIHLNDLPAEIAEALSATALEICFRESERIEEAQTLR